MTNTFKTEQHDGRGFASGELTAKAYAAVGIGIDIKPEGGDKAMLNLSAQDSHRLADWIKANVPLPEPEPEPTLFERQWPQVKIGDELGFGGEPNPHYPYTKVSETEYEYGSGLYVKSIDQVTPGDLARGIHWRTPKPTNYDQVQALPVGTIFQFERGALWMRTANGVLDLFLAAKFQNNPRFGSEGIPASWKNNHYTLNIIKEGV